MNFIEIAKPQILKKAKKQCQKKAGTNNVFSLLLEFNVLKNNSNAVLISDKKEINTELEANEIKNFILAQINNKFKTVIKEIHQINILFNFLENKITYSLFFLDINNNKTSIQNEL